MNRLHVYTGSGKGKTTAAMGLALRSLGHGNKVLVGQFLKDGTSGELRALSACGADVYLPPLTEGFVAGMNEERQQKTMKDYASYIDLLQQKIGQLQPKTIILDELGMALALDMVEKTAAIILIDDALRYGETIVTGNAVPEWLLKRADYLTRMEAVRHPYSTEGLAARIGVEW